MFNSPLASSNCSSSHDAPTPRCTRSNNINAVAAGGCYRRGQPTPVAAAVVTATSPLLAARKKKGRKFMIIPPVSFLGFEI